MLIILLVQESLKYPSCLHLDKVAIFVPLNGKYPSASDKVFARHFSEINKLKKNIVVNPGLVPLVFRFKELLDILLLVGRSSFLTRTIGSLELCCLIASPIFLFCSYFWLDLDRDSGQGPPAGSKELHQDRRKKRVVLHWVRYFAWCIGSQVRWQLRVK